MHGYSRYNSRCSSFEDTIKTKQFLLKSKSHKTHSELGSLLSDLMRHEWFTHDIQQTLSVM